MSISSQNPEQKTPEVIKIDEKDRAIIDALRVDARIPATELEPVVDLTAGAVRRRLERLSSAGVFGGMRINERVIGDAVVEAYVFLNFIKIEEGRTLLQDALREHTLTSAVMLFGENPDAIGHMQGESTQDVREKFAGLRVAGIVESANLLIVADSFNTAPLTS